MGQGLRDGSGEYLVGVASGWLGPECMPPERDDFPEFLESFLGRDVVFERRV